MASTYPHCTWKIRRVIATASHVVAALRRHAVEFLRNFRICHEITSKYVRDFG